MNDEPEFDLPPEDDPLVQGAAADSAEASDEIKALPRIIRYALIAKEEKSWARERLCAEIDELAPQLANPVGEWLAQQQPDLGLALAAKLDRAAVEGDKPELRSLADSVRILCLPMPKGRKYRAEFNRVAKSLIQAQSKLPEDMEADLSAEIEEIVFGWACLPLTTDLLSSHFGGSAHRAARRTGALSGQYRVAAAYADAEARYAARPSPTSRNIDDGPAKQGTLPCDHIAVCTIDEAALKNARLRELIASVKTAVNVPLPLISVPDLRRVRQALLSEFPYAVTAVEGILNNLVGRRTVFIQPVCLVGPPGCGKSRFARRVGELLGISIWRTDAGGADGAVFGGTDKRWHSAEPCHPFLAIARAGHGNPLCLIEEVEKAATRVEYGRFWDCLLAFLEPESALRYPDPALQCQIDVSHVSYIATANSLRSLPPPLMDRFSVIEFERPQATHIDAMLPSIVADIASQKGLDLRWVPPIAGWERDLIASHWAGGSIRLLRRLVDLTLLAREKNAVAN
jgi:ATP-dependent Lon protease